MNYIFLSVIVYVEMASKSCFKLEIEVKSQKKT